MQLNELEFKTVEEVDNIAQTIENIFDVKLDITGGWGYDNESVVIINNLKIPIEQFVHMFATIRATIEMNLMLDSNQKYGGINPSLSKSKKLTIDNKEYNIFTFKVTAMNEKIYANFIKEYKDGYGKKDFDLNNHFKRREENTISREIDYWFYRLEN